MRFTDEAEGLVCFCLRVEVLIAMHAVGLNADFDSLRKVCPVWESDAAGGHDGLHYAAGDEAVQTHAFADGGVDVVEVG